MQNRTGTCGTGTHLLAFGIPFCNQIGIFFAALLFLIFSAGPAFGSQQIMNGSAGNATLGSDFIVTGISTASPAGTLSFDCPITSTGGAYPLIYHCSGGGFNFASNDGTMTITGSFVASGLDLYASGGGRGGNIHYDYDFFGSFTGVQTVSGISAAITGEIVFAMGPFTTEIGTKTVTIGASTTAVNWQYGPIYVTDNSNSQLVRSDDMFGTNKALFGGYGSATNGFIYPRGVAVDASGRIYVADTGNCRIVRMDDITGKNWTTLGQSCGAGTNQFGGPIDIAIDASGRIYVADSTNNRIVRFDDMTGANWIAFGTFGSGTNQLSYPNGVAIDSAGKIYIGDSDNSRIVRVDDMTGTNWTALAQSPDINGYIYHFGAPEHIAIDAAGRIVVADFSNIIRVDDMTGTNWTEIAMGATVQGISINSAGTTYEATSPTTSGYSEALFDDLTTGAGFLGTSLVQFPGGIYSVSVPAPVPAVIVGPTSLAFGSEDTGMTTAAQDVTVTNFGSAPLDFNSVTATPGFVPGDGCGPSLQAGSSCTISVSYAPTATGPDNGTLTISDNAFTGTQTVSLSGNGTAPVAGVSPTGVTFLSQQLNTTSSAQIVFLGNTGTGPLFFTGSGIAASGDFAETNNCGSQVLAGTSCEIEVTFTPTATGPRTGNITVTDNAGTQTVSLAGTGTGAAPTVTAMPESLVFPTQLVKTKSAVQSVILSNTGATAVAVASVSINGDFAKTGACPAKLAAGKTCTLKVTFTPTAAGARTGALTFNVPTGAVMVPLTGTGTSTATGWLVISPASFAFNNGYVVGDNPSQDFTVTNTNSVPAGITKIALSGSTTFTQKNNCTTSLGPNASCTITLTFVPTAVGTVTGTLTVTEGAGTAHKIPLSGTAGIDN